VSIDSCPICGSSELEQHAILWPELIADWELSPEEAAYIDEQQGFTCARCRVNLRAMTLASALMEHFGYAGLFRDFCAGPLAAMDVLEINEANQLTKDLDTSPRHVLAKYPEVDMRAMPYADASFDVVIHSDTLEHVPDAVAALRDCRRVLRDGGVLAYTVPIVVGRRTRSRIGMKESFHGSGEPDNLVQTEYGADAWCEAMEAGFREVKLHALRYPASIAILARKLA
jgi:SAM-dependent methyltransferase